MRRGAPKRMRSTSACSSMSSGRPPSRITVTMLPAAGSGARARKMADGLRTSLRPALGHGEEAELVDRAEAVLGGAHDAKAAAGLALEVEDGVHQVLEHPRAGDRAFLGDVADEDDRGGRGLGKADQLRRAFPQLRDRAGAGGDRARLHASGSSLRPAAPRCRPAGLIEDGLQVRLAPAPRERPRRCRSRRARSATCATDSSPLAYSTPRPAATCAATCSSSVDLPMPGSPAQKGHRARDEAATEHPIELRPGHSTGAARSAPARPRAARAPRSRRPRRPAGPDPAPGAPLAAHRPLLERVPLAAGRALPLPFQGLGPAGAADEYGDRTRHGYASRTSGAGLS